METIKSYTDISQSKKLAEILPIESADMWYQYTGISIKDGSKKPIYFPMVIRDCESDEDIPCWSLVALLGVLPMIRKGEDTANPFIAKTPDAEYYIVYATLTEEVDNSSMYDNPVDACVAMIDELHELKML